MAGLAEQIQRHREASAAHPENVREFCRRLYEEFDRTPTEIGHILRERGYEPVPSWAAIRSWCDPDYRRTRLSGARARHATKRGAAFRKVSRKRGWHYRLERIQELRSLGISYRSIAVLASHDFGLSLTANQIEYLLKKDPATATMRRLLWPQGAGA